MKRLLVAVSGAIGLLCSVTLVAQHQPETPRLTPMNARCSTAELRGVYGFFRSGTTTQGPLAAVGTGSFDGVGTFEISQMTSRNGTFTQGGFGGTYEVNGDCTGRWLTPDGQGLGGFFVLLKGGDEFFFLSTMAGNTVSGHAQRIAMSPGR